MGKQRNEHGRETIGDGPPGPDAPDRSAGSSTQGQGGISHRVAQAARAQFDAAAGLPGGLPKVDPPAHALDQGGGARSHSGRAEHGFSGDDGAHVPTDSTGTPASLQPGAVADLGAQQDTRLHGRPQDAAERTTGADTPSRGGIAGSPGGPVRTAAAHMPGEEPDEGVIQGGQSGNDEQRDPQI